MWDQICEGEPKSDDESAGKPENEQAQTSAASGDEIDQEISDHVPADGSAASTDVRLTVSGWRNGIRLMTDLPSASAWLRRKRAMIVIVMRAIIAAIAAFASGSVESLLGAGGSPGTKSSSGTVPSRPG